MLRVTGTVSRTLLPNRPASVAIRGGAKEERLCQDVLPDLFW